MATTPNSVITVQTPKMDVQQFSTADTPGTYKTLAQGASNGTKVNGIWATSNDSTAHTMTVQLQRSGINYGGVTSTIPTSAGFSASSPAVNMMAPASWPGLPVDSDGNPFLFLQSTLDLLVATYSIAISTGISGVINAAAVRGDF